MGDFTRVAGAPRADAAYAAAWLAFRQASRSQRLCLCIGVVLALAAMFSAMLPLLVGLPASGASGGLDADFAIAQARHFADAMAAGTPWPRWLPMGNAGFGSPVFLFYPPIPFHLATIATIATDNAALAVGFGMVLARLMLAVALLSLAPIIGTAGAVAGAVLAQLFPYAAVIAPFARSAYAEIVATGFLAVAFAGTVHWVVRRQRLALLAIAMGTAASLMSNLPVAIPALGLIGLLALLAAGYARAALPPLAALLAGVLLAGAYVLPAVSLRHLIEADAWFRPNIRPENNLLFGAGNLALGNLRQVSTILYYLAFTLMAAACALGVVVARGATDERRRLILALAATIAIGLASTTVLARPLWLAVPLMAFVQTPFRVFALLGLMACVLVALARPALAPRGRTRLDLGLLAIAACLAVMAALVPLSRDIAALAGRPNVRGYTFEAPGLREARALRQGGNVPEYVPYGRGQAWTGEGDAITPPQSVADDIAAQRIARAEGEGHVLRVTPPAAWDGRIAQFWFPGWSATGAQGVLPVQEDRATGLLRVDPAAAGGSVELRREALPAQTFGLAVSALGLVATALLLLW